MDLDGAPSGGQPVQRGPRRRRLPPPDTLQGHPYLAFPNGTPSTRHCQKLRRMHIGSHAAIDWDAIDEIRETVRVRRFIPVDSPWHHLFELAHTPSYKELLVAFLSSFTFHPHGPQCRFRIQMLPLHLRFHSSSLAFCFR
ncbi:hypothetical protein Hanom_Chr11g01029151 [Helianthus anomalus]